MDAAEAGQGEVLVADVGNTETRLGLACDGELAATWATTTPEHLTADEAYLVLRGLLDLHAAESGGRPQPCGAIMASVVPDLTERPPAPSMGRHAWWWTGARRPTSR